MMPLWTTATLVGGDADGRCFSVGAPCVAQRVWPMPIVPRQRLALEPRHEIVELALGAAALDAAVDQRRDAGRIIAAIFEPAQPLDQLAGDGFRPMMPTMPHISASILPLEAAAAQFGGAARLVDWRARAMGQRVGGTSAVMTLPVAI